MLKKLQNKDIIKHQKTGMEKHASIGIIDLKIDEIIRELL